MKVGVTGTRTGWTPEQEKSFVGVMLLKQSTEFHFGDCVGVDDEAALIMGHFVPRPKIIGHPPADEKHRAFNQCADEWREPKNHFARNREIVDEVDLLVVIPWSTEHQPTGGTWYTHDYAVKKEKAVVVIWPNGDVHYGGA